MCGGRTLPKSIRTLKIRLYPNREQEIRLLDTLSKCCHLYNSLLEYCRDCHEEGLKHPSAFDMMAALPQRKREDPSLKTVYSQVLEDVCSRVSGAFDGFFRRAKENAGDPGYPRFRSWKRYDSFTYPQSGFKLSKDRLILSPDKQSIRIRGYRKMEGKIKTCIVIRKGCAPNYRWEAAVTFESETKNKKTSQPRRAVGMDMGLKNLVVTSEGREYPNSKEFVKAERQLSKIQRKMSRYEKGSPGRERYRQRLFHAFDKLNDKRRGMMYGIINDLVDDHDMIIMEDLHTRKMTEKSLGKGMRKSYRDASWSKFMFILGYKAEEAGVLLVKVDPQYTSQRCSGCGILVPKDLSVRRHQCPHCGLDVDRD